MISFRVKLAISQHTLPFIAAMGLGVMVASTALSAPQPSVFVLLGSFEVEAEAQNRLKDVQTKHAGLLADLHSTVREVEIRPGLKVYRTQAGPVVDRAQAQSICSQLSSNGDECYIIETVLPQQEPASKTQLAKPATAPEPSVISAEKLPAIEAVEEASKTAIAQNTQAVEPLSALPSHVADGATRTVNHAAQPVNALYDKVASAQAREPITDTAKAIKQGSEETLASTSKRDPQTRQLLHSLEPTESTAPVAAQQATAPIRIVKQQGEGADIAAREASIEEALQKARDNQPVITQKPAEEVLASTKETAWYDALNPFSDDEDDAPKAAAERIKAASVEEEAPAPSRSIAAVTAQPEQIDPAYADTQLPPPPSVESAASISAPKTASTPTTSWEVAQPQQGDALAAKDFAVEQPAEVGRSLSPTTSALAVPDLPPPPLPEGEAARRTLAQRILQEPVATGTPLAAASAPVIQPVQAEEVPAGTVDLSPRLTDEPAPSVPAAEARVVVPSSSIQPVIPAGVSITKAAEITAKAEADAAKAQALAAQNVAVEEARRVPLTEGEPAFVPPTPVVAHGAPLGIAPEDLPSQTLQSRTLWAHMSFFDTKQSALRFWQDFRNQNPDFPSVRVRVTSAYVSQEVGRHSVSLRIGPFANIGFIEELCEDDAVDDADLECKAVRDLGSASFGTARSAAPRDISLGRYGHNASGAKPGAGNWVQLGTFNSAATAKAEWDALRTAHTTMLRAMRPHITTPLTGSNARPVYRLRTGPFVNQAAAEELCLRLKESGTSCLVVAEQRY